MVRKEAKQDFLNDNGSDGIKSILNIKYKVNNRFENIHNKNYDLHFVNYKEWNIPNPFNNIVLTEYTKSYALNNNNKLNMTKNMNLNYKKQQQQKQQQQAQQQQQTTKTTKRTISSQLQNVNNKYNINNNKINEKSENNKNITNRFSMNYLMKQ
jgi:hypothetical protein